MTEEDTGHHGELTRRDLLRRGLRIGGAVWAVPVVQMINMAPAHGYGGSKTSGELGTSSPSSG